MFHRITLLLICAITLTAQTQTALQPQTPTARTGKITIRQTETGIVVSGAIEGPAPQFAATSNDMPQKDHVEIWLAPARTPALPPIGWGNQFGPIEDKTEKDCPEISSEPKAVAECRAWFRAQPAYRTQFRRLFVRQWQLAPNIATETFATPAYTELSRRFGKDNPLQPLAPSGTVTARFEPKPNGYTFEAAIPWTAFPPMDQLALQDLHLMVDIFSAHDGPARSQPYSTTSAQRKWGEPSTFPIVKLETARRHRITTCEYPLQAANSYGDSRPALYIPTAAGTIQDVFIVQNPAAGYQYNPGGYSPVIRRTHYFERAFGSGNAVCGPTAAYRINNTVRRTEQQIDEEGLAILPQPDSSFLIKSGPHVTYSEFGSGQCGACPLVRLGIFRLTNDAQWKELYSYFSAIEDTDNFDLTVAPDAKSVTITEGKLLDGGKIDWTTTTYCPKPGPAYTQCTQRKGTPPKQPRTLKF